MERYLKYNVSCYFWLKPITDCNLQKHVEAGFINSFLEFDNLKGLFLEYNITNKYFNLLIELSKNKNFIDEYNVGNTSILHFDIGEEWKSDYNLFLEGKYSQKSLELKNKFSKKIKDRYNNEVDSLQWKIFDKNVTLKQELEKYIRQELPEGVDYFFKPNLNNEKWRINC
jgi:hypothetical protein